jgi:hypothetical protein
MFGIEAGISEKSGHYWINERISFISGFENLP